LIHLDGIAGESAQRPRRYSDFVKLTAFNEPDEFVPLGARQPNDVGILADCNALIGNLDFRAGHASRA